MDINAAKPDILIDDMVAKQLSSKEVWRRKIIGAAIKDYFGVRIPEEQFERLYKAIHDGKIHRLEKYEAHHAYLIADNIKDKDYVAAF